MGKGRLELKNYCAHGLASVVRVLAGGIALLLVNVAFAAKPGWYSSFEQAMETARQQKKPVFVDFSTSWCGICKQMDRSTLADPTIIQRLDSFVKVEVDGDARQDLCSAFGVAAFPTFIHLDPNGRMIEKREGFMRVQDLAATLDNAYQVVNASNTAVAQAPRTSRQPEQAAGNTAGNNMTIASAAATNNLLSAPGAPNSRGTRNVAQEEQGNAGSAKPATDNVAYDKADPRLQGSVYAMGASPTSDRRSRFGGAVTAQSGLRELAEATANPGAVEESQAPTRPDAESAEKEASKETKETALADKETDKKAKAEDEDKKPASDDKLIAETKAKLEADKKALESESKQVAKAAPSPVIESRLTGLSEAELPKPLLSRTVTGSSLAAPAAAAPTIKAVSNTAPGGDPLATIRRIQGGNGATAEPAAAVKVSAKTQEITANKADTKAEETEAKAEKAEVDTEKEPAKEVASATAEKKVSSASGSSESDSKADSPDKSKSADEPKTEAGATKSDIDRWMKEADGKLVSDKKKEARAMYNKVVDKDPGNKFGKSDVAYVKMVSLIVDKDSDLLRRQAYNKIKEFEARFPESENKDYYTLIRAILAADLGETNEAHRLLGTFPERFPESRYAKKAHEIWKDLPPLKKESSKESASSKSSSGSSKRKSNDG